MDAERETARQDALASRLKAEQNYRDAADEAAQRDADDAETARRAAGRRELPLHWRSQLDAAEARGDLGEGDAERDEQ